MKNKNWIIAGAVVALLIISYICGRYSTKQERDNAVNNILALKDTIHASTVTINGLTNYVSEQKALILSQKDALATSELEKERLKKLALSSVVTNAALTGEIKVLRDSLKLVPGTVILTVDDTTMSVNGGDVQAGDTAIPANWTTKSSHEYVQIPFTLLNINEENINLTAGMSTNKSPYFSLSVPFKGSMTVGYKKSGLFKTTPVGIFTTTNPYIHVNDMQVVIIQNPSPWYDKWWVHALGGAVIFETARQLLLK